jgi:Mlc titration factor MtfA (ptsG expression regulator)
VSFAATLLVALAALLVVAGIIAWPQLRQRLFARHQLSPKQRRILFRRLPWSAALRPRQRDQLCGNAAQLLAETTFIGAPEATVNDRQRLIIAGQAALLGLGAQPMVGELPSEIVIYSAAIDSGVEASPAYGLVEDLADMAIGLHPSGSRIALSWPAVNATLAGSVRNPVVRAFVHLTNFSDPLNEAGIAPAADSWPAALAEHQTTIENTGSALIDLPADASPERFLALAAEAFFQQPKALRETHPGLYDLLSAYFDLDTASQPPRFRRRKMNR